MKIGYKTVPDKINYIKKGVYLKPLPLKRSSIQ